MVSRELRKWYNSWRPPCSITFETSSYSACRKQALISMGDGGEREATCNIVSHDLAVISVTHYGLGS